MLVGCFGYEDGTACRGDSCRNLHNSLNNVWNSVVEACHDSEKGHDFITQYLFNTLEHIIIYKL